MDYLPKLSFLNINFPRQNPAKFFNSLVGFIHLPWSLVRLDRVGVSKPGFPGITPNWGWLGQKGLNFLSFHFSQGTKTEAFFLPLPPRGIFVDFLFRIYPFLKFPLSYSNSSFKEWAILFGRAGQLAGHSKVPSPFQVKKGFFLIWRPHKVSRFPTIWVSPWGNLGATPLGFGQDFTPFFSIPGPFVPSESLGVTRGGPSRVPLL